jgi:MATE family multidrug resistance protein
MGRADAAAALSSPLVEDDQRSFVRKELGIMCSMGWPMLVSFFSRMAMASVDSAFVGHITDGEHSPGTYLAAAGLSDMVTSLLVIPPLAFNQSLNALVGQAMGSGNKKMAGTWLQLSLFWLTLGYLPVLITFFYVEPMLRLLGFTEEICVLAGSYARFNVFWPIPNGWYQCMRFYMQAQGITRPAMFNNPFFLGVNVLLNWIFVFGGPFRAYGWHGFGFVGAAMSLSISRSSQPLAYWLYVFVWKKMHLATWPGWSRDFLKAEHQKAFLTMALPQIGTLILQATIGQSTTLLLAQLGPLAVAASSATTAATQVFTGGLQPTLTAIGGIRVGFHLGQGEPDRARQVAWMTMMLGAGATAVVACILLPLGTQVMNIVTSDSEVAEIATWLLPAVLLNILGGIAVQVGTGGVLTSQGRPKLVTFLSMGFELPLSLGSVAAMVLLVHAKLPNVYWVQSTVTCVEAVVVWVLIVRSNWAKHSEEAQERQASKHSVEMSPEPERAPLPSAPPLSEGRMSPVPYATPLQMTSPAMMSPAAKDTVGEVVHSPRTMEFLLRGAPEENEDSRARKVALRRGGA